MLSSDVVVVCPGGGTLSEIGLALKHKRPVITMGFQLEAIPGIFLNESLLYSAKTPEEVIAIIKGIKASA